MLHFTSGARQVFIDPVRRLAVSAGEQVTDHEAHGVVVSILPSAKSIHTLHDVFATQIRIRTSDPFAFDDRMRVVFPCSQEHFNHHQRDVGSPIGN